MSCLHLEPHAPCYLYWRFASLFRSIQIVQNHRCRWSKVKVWRLGAPAECIICLHYICWQDGFALQDCLCLVVSLERVDVSPSPMLPDSGLFDLPFPAIAQGQYLNKILHGSTWYELRMICLWSIFRTWIWICHVLEMLELISLDFTSRSIGRLGAFWSAELGIVERRLVNERQGCQIMPLESIGQT